VVCQKAIVGTIGEMDGPDNRTSVKYARKNICVLDGGPLLVASYFSLTWNCLLFSCIIFLHLTCRLDAFAEYIYIYIYIYPFNKKDQQREREQTKQSMVQKCVLFDIKYQPGITTSTPNILKKFGDEDNSLADCYE
jgi:hypothetical protein